MSDSRDFFPPKEISSPEGAKTPVKSPNLMSTSSSVGFSSPVRPPKRTSTSAAPAMTQDAIRQLVVDSVATALKAQAANMANTDNTNKNTRTSGTPIARKGINNHKRKFEDRGNTTTNNNYPKHNNNNHSNNHINKNNYPDNHNNDYHQQQHRRQETIRTYPAKKYHGNRPLCTRCTLHHTGVCTVKCRNCTQAWFTLTRELLKQRTSREEHANRVCNLSCLWRERALLQRVNDNGFLRSGVEQVIEQVAVRSGMDSKVAELLFAGITHGAEGRNLTDVTAYNPSAETDYISSLQRLQSLMVPIHRSTDQTVIGATALSLSLNVSYARVQKIRENIANHRSALRDIFIPLAEPLSFVALEGMEDTSGTDPNTTTALSVTFASVSSIPPISTDNYEVVHADGQGGVGADANTFPNVDDAELNI
ncbi:hypothetical protein Tco_0223414 [Tanacetum coccineum]